jgi:hypothetical protein
VRASSEILEQNVHYHTEDRNFVQAGFDAQLDSLHAARHNAGADADNLASLSLA